MIFQLPIGDHPFRVGTKVRSKVRPQWGVGEVIQPGGIFPHTGQFSVRWSDGMISRGQVKELELEQVEP